jgi:diguanylate cyclase (GGDEF)-like protein
MGNDRELSETLAEFARTMVPEFSIQSIVDRLVERIVEILPISAAGVTLMSTGPGDGSVAASHESAMCLEHLQSELAQGPSVDAYHCERIISAPDLCHETRFPQFTARALEAGLVAIFAFPMRHSGSHLGTLALYRNIPGPLDPDSLRAAAMLADVTAAYLVNARERTDLQEVSDRSRHASLHDGLTGLPNRMLMLERLDHAILRDRRSGLTSALLYMDLDRFKAVNDTYGHAMGDDLLVAVARRLTGVLRPGDTLARLSGDEFVILCEDLPHASASGGIVHRVETALADPFVLSSIELDVTASIGIACTSAGCHSASEVLHFADAAMYGAKRAVSLERLHRGPTPRTPLPTPHA